MERAIREAIEKTDFNGGSYGMCVAIETLRMIADDFEEKMRQSDEDTKRSLQKILASKD